MTSPNASRRLFLRQVGALSAAGAAAAPLALNLAAVGSAAAQSSSDYKAIVCIFMYGGNDGNNMLVPRELTEYNQYQRLRTNLALPRDSLLPIAPNNTGSFQYGLHPAMAGIQGLFNQGKATLIANVGPLAVPTTKAQWDARSVPLPDNLFSHSDQQAQWQSALVDQPSRSGWGGRMMERQLSSGIANRGYGVLSVVGSNLWETGDANLAAYKVSASGNFGFDFYNASGSDPLSLAISQTLAEQRPHLLESAWTDVVGRSIENQRILTQALGTSTLATVFPDTGLGRQLRMIARLVAARTQLGLPRQCFFCSVGGFDTHGDDQMQRQNELLGEISAAVTAFYAATSELGMANKVTLFSASDFGRTLQSNGKGSDHGWGNQHFCGGRRGERWRDCGQLSGFDLERPQRRWQWQMDPHHLGGSTRSHAGPLVWRGRGAQ